MKNVDRQPATRWTQAPPERTETKQIGYFFGVGQARRIPKAIEDSFGFAVDWSSWELPDHCPCPLMIDQPIAVVKATTVRTEWKSQSRNPMPDYVNWVAGRLMKTHFVVSVADLYSNEESLVGNPPPCHIAFHRGEMTIEKLIALVRHADVIVGGVGWNVPMSIALKVKSFVVLGGRGAHNAPEVITDPKMDLTRIGFATPRQYCQCSSALHECDKMIPDLKEQWERYCDAVRLTRLGTLPGGLSESATIR